MPSFRRRRWPRGYSTATLSVCVPSLKNTWIALAIEQDIPIHELPHRVDEVPEGELWVHCASGYRASIAASVLDAAGRKLVAIDDSFENAEKVGLHLVGPEA